MSIQKASELADIAVIPTGLFVDKLTGVAGIPRGHITEIFGDPGIGKSSVCLQIVAAAQQRGINCLWVDTEWAYTPRYATALGVRNEDLGLLRERCAEDILDTLERELENSTYSLVVIDSIGGLTPRAEIEKEHEGRVIGAQANLVAKFCRKVVPLLILNNIALVVINHSLIDIMSGKLTTSGGRKLAYHKAISIRLKTANKKLMSGETQTGKVVIGQVWGKNRLAGNEGTTLEAQFLFNKGFSASADLFENALTRGVITRKGNTFYLGERKLGSKNKARELLESDAGLRKEVESLAAKV